MALCDSLSGQLSDQAEYGVTMTEYAVLFGLVIVLGIGGVKLLGGSVSKLLDGSGEKASSTNTLQLLESSNASSASGNLGLKGSGYYAIAVNPATGQPELTMIRGANATATNVSSIDGSMMNSLGSTMLSNSLGDMAAQQTDPELRDYYNKMAKAAYYLAAAEGEMDNVAGLDIMPAGPNGSTYTKGDGLQDIVKFSAELDKLMNNPPGKLDSSDYLQAMPLAMNAYNIAHQYENAYSRFIQPDGKVPVAFGIPANCTPGNGCPTGNGTPGSSLLMASQAVANPPGVIPMIHQSYDQFATYDQLRTTADTVLASHQVDGLPVASTIQDGQGLYAVAQQTPAVTPSSTTDATSALGSTTTTLGGTTTSSGSPTDATTNSTIDSTADSTTMTASGLPVTRSGCGGGGRRN